MFYCEKLSETSRRCWMFTRLLHFWNLSLPPFLVVKPDLQQWGPNVSEWLKVARGRVQEDWLNEDGCEGQPWQSKRAEWAIDNCQTKTTGVTVMAVIGFLSAEIWSWRLYFHPDKRPFSSVVSGVCTPETHFLCAWNGGFMNVTWIPGATSHEEWTDASVSFNTLLARDCIWKRIPPVR